MSLPTVMHTGSHSLSVHANEKMYDVRECTSLQPIYELLVFKNAQKIVNDSIAIYNILIREYRELLHYVKAVITKKSFAPVSV